VLDPPKGPVTCPKVTKKGGKSAKIRKNPQKTQKMGHFSLFVKKSYFSYFFAKNQKKIIKM